MPSGRLTGAEESAAATVFLASNASFITASTFVFDGRIHGACVTPL